MTDRLTSSSRAGTSRKLVAVGTWRLSSMLATIRAAAPRNGTACSSAEPRGAGAGFDEGRAATHLEHGIGHVTRIGASTGLRPSESAALMNAVQRYAVERTRLGVPVVVHEESTGGYCARDATVFPQAIGLAATWDSALVEDVAAVIRTQLRAVGARHTLAPVLDIARDPRWGGVEETYGENRVLA